MKAIVYYLTSKTMKHIEYKELIEQCFDQLVKKCEIKSIEAKSQNL